MPRDTESIKATVFSLFCFSMLPMYKYSALDLQDVVIFGVKEWVSDSLKKLDQVKQCFR